MSPLVLLAAIAASPPVLRAQDQQHYHVLLVGVPQPAGSLFPNLSAVDKDLKGLALVLEKNWHVPADSVVIEDSSERTTKQGIVDLIQKTLIEPCKKGDVVYFGYSGHGYQVFDDSKPAKLSQAIVPADVRYLGADDPKRGLKQGEVDPDSLLTGPEIGKLFDPLKNVTSNVTLTFDCCHSGQITRGAFRARGADNPAVARYLARGGKQQDDETIGNVIGGRGLVCLSAAAPDQLAWESSDGGVFTQALLHALQNPGTGKRSYQSLFNEIYAQCKSEKLPAPQDPQIEGDASRAILGADYIPPSPSMEVHMAGNRLVMMGGRVVGMKPGFLVGIYPAGTEDFKQTPNWTATITSVDTAQSELKLSKDSEKSLSGDFTPLMASAQAIVLDGRTDGTIRVYVGDLPSDLQSAVAADLKDAPIVDPEAPGDDFDYRFARSPSAGPGTANQWDLVDRTEGANPKPVTTFALTGDVAAQAAKLSEMLQSIARRNAVLALQPDSKPETEVEMQLVPCDIPPGADLVSALHPDKPLPPGQNANDAVKFAIRVRLKKTGQNSAQFAPYIAVLNVNPDPSPNPPANKPRSNRVDQIWPAFDANGEVSTPKQFRQLSLDRGWQYLGRNNDLVSGDKPSDVAAWDVDCDTDGLGPELFKVFAVDQDVNFAPLLDRTRGARGSSSVLAKTLGNFANSEPRSRSGQATAGPDVQHWCTASIILNVVANPP